MLRTYFIDSIDNNYFRLWLVYSKEGLSLWRTYFIDSIDNNYFRLWLVYSKEGRPCGERILLIQWIITISECGLYTPKRGVPVAGKLYFY